MTNTRILIIGASGQIGQELTAALRTQHGVDNVIASDLRQVEGIDNEGPFINLNVLDRAGVEKAVEDFDIDVVYHLAALLSASGEKNPLFAWELNMQGLLNILEIARSSRLQQIFWPSSIAVSGPESPKTHAPQSMIMDPNTVYGISKLAGERWCDYYAEKYDIDVRSLRYPGLISYKSPPGGGTTDYAVDIFHHAIKTGTYTSFLSEDTELPMMYMPDAIRATIQLMDAPKDQIKIRSSYNLAGFSVTPAQLVKEIQQHIPSFQCEYAPDFRQAIADTWADSVDDSVAQKDWGWKPEYDLSRMVKDMIVNIKKMYSQTATA